MFLLQSRIQLSRKEKSLLRKQTKVWMYSSGMTKKMWWSQRATRVMIWRWWLKKRRSVFKPVAKLDYDKGKCSVDKSDQMSSYSTCMRKTIKWYRKVIIELVWGTSLVNAHFLLLKNNISNQNMSITDFKIAVIRGLVSNLNPALAATSRPRASCRSRSSPRSTSREEARPLRCYDTYGRNGTMVGGRRKQPSGVEHLWPMSNIHVQKMIQRLALK